MMENENENTETVIEESETVLSERRPRSRERGPDKKPRTYRASSMRNFVQFKDNPKEFAKYLKDEKGIDIAGNSNLTKMFLILGGIGLAGFGGWWLYTHYKNGRNDNIENR